MSSIHDLLTDEGFAYPSEGYVNSLTEALTPTSTMPAESVRMASAPENYRRAELFKKRPAGPFHIADCDLFSFVYLGIAAALDLPLRLMERQRSTDGDQGHNWVRWILEKDVLDWDAMTGSVYARGASTANYLSDAELTGYLLGLRGDNFSRAWAFHEAKAAYLAAVAHGYKNVAELNQLAWISATSPDPALRSPSLALEYAHEAVERAPDMARLSRHAGRGARVGRRP